MFENNNDQKKWKDIQAAALDPNLVGPTFSAIPSFSFPTGPTGATGTTGTCNCPSSMAEIQGTGIQFISNGTTQAINFNGGIQVGDGTVGLNNTDIILPETGSYIICYIVSGSINATGDTSAASMSTNLRQLNTGGTFNQTIVGSTITVNINGNNTSLLANSSISNCTLVCVTDTGGGNLNNIIQLLSTTANAQGTVTAINIQRNQTSITIAKYSNEVCS